MDDGINNAGEVLEVPRGREAEPSGVLEGRIKGDELEEIRKIFESGGSKMELKKAEFRSKVIARLGIDISDEEFDILCTKLDYNKNDLISWGEFISYLMLELDSKKTESTKSVSIESPIVDDPIVIKSHHRSSIIHITYCPSVRLDGTVDHDDGKFVSMSKDGCVNFWSLDLRLLRSYRDKPLHQSVRCTWVTNFVCLPDVNVLVTASTERELRFYDTTSKGFHLILVIVVMPFCVNDMHYHFTENLKEESIIICGDLGGNVRVMQFSKEDRGPFKQSIGVDVVVCKWEQLVKGKLPRMKAFNVIDIHSDWVKEVSYYKLLGSFVSCSSSPTAMFIGDHHGFRNSHTFVLKRGIETFCLNEYVPMIVTGSLDCVLRLWNPFITSKPISVFRGHHASIVKIFLQDHGRLVFSLDKDRTVKVWESSTQNCLQTYTGFADNVCRSKEFCAFYNDRNHLLITAECHIGAVVCGKLNDELISDGKTHSWKVCAVLYNRLFDCLITCGMDSNIVIWDIWKNKAIRCIRMAHSCVSMGVKMPVPITAATLDPPHQLLLTGSRDGSIKMWDFNNGLCLRNLSVGKGQEVTKLIWLKNRILAVGWCSRVVEFSDSFSTKMTLGKDWELRHSDDILAADFRPGQAIATCTYNGDLIFWKLETGQSYKRYNVTYPTGLFKLEYMRKKSDKKAELESITSKGSRGSSRGRKEKSRQGKSSPKSSPQKATGLKEPKVPVKNLFVEKPQPHTQRKLAVHCLIFLRSRETLPDQATLLTATENGMIQVWSHHPSGSFLQAFKATHSENDYVCAMTTDAENEFLFTGTLLGYIKIWLMKNFCLTQGSSVDICMPLYRLQFPFLIKDRIWMRAKLAVRYQPEPLLLSSYRGHLSAILYFEYLPECKILLSGSADGSVRLWTLSGRYLGTLGQNKPWPHIRPGTDPEKNMPQSEFRIPPDLKRKSSHTTLKVLTGAPPIITKKYDDVVDLSITEAEKKYGVYGKATEEPHVGHYHNFSPKLTTRKKLLPVDETMLNIPVFVHLKMAAWKPFEAIANQITLPSLKKIGQKSQNGESDPPVHNLLA